MENTPQHLIDLVSFEKTTLWTQISENAEVKFKGDYIILRNLNKVSIHINDKGLQLNTNLDDKFIAQIVKRIHDKYEQKTTAFEEHVITTSKESSSWNKQTAINYIELNIYLHYRLNHDLVNLLAAIKEEICNLITVYSPSGNIYGFVSESYRPTNQIQFRNEFLNLCNKYDSRFNVEKSESEIKKGRVIEYFDYLSEDSEFNIKCGLIYGKNNGYGSYYVTWVREFKETNAKLLPFITNNKYNWQNNPRILSKGKEYHLDEFTKHVAEEGNSILKVCDKLVEYAKNELINSSLIMDVFDNILSKVACAQASKDRVKGHYKNLYLVLDGKEDKNSLWAIAHSICYTGTFERAIPFSMRELLLKAGTELIDDGFTKFNNKYEKDGIRLTINYI